MVRKATEFGIRDLYKVIISAISIFRGWNFKLFINK